MRPSLVSAEGSRLLTYDDLAIPLSQEQVMDADAILFGAGVDGNAREVKAFGYYHRKRLAELVEEPAIDSAGMIDELFDTLPDKLSQDALISRLTAEVEELSNTNTEETVQSLNSVQAVSQPQRRSSVVSVRQISSEQETLFPSENAAINAEPSAELLKTAKKLDDYSKNFLDNFGHIPKFMKGKNKFVRSILFVPGLLEVLAELPILLLIDNTYGTRLKVNFSKAMRREYPHLRRELGPTDKLGSGVLGFDDAPQLKYATALLGNNNTEDALGVSDNNDPPSAHPDLFTKSHKEPTKTSPKPNHLTTLLEHQL